MNKWCVREVQVENVLNNGHIEKATAVLICVKDKATGLTLPHPITHFIRQKYNFKGVSLSTQLNAAREICKFLNFVNEQVELGEQDFIALKDKGIFGLELIHGSKFITYLTNKRDKNNEQLTYGYVKRIEGYVTYFYEYLSKMEIIEHIEFDHYVDAKKEKITMTPFDHPKLNTVYPSTSRKVKHKLKDFGKEKDERDTMVVEFLKVAEAIAPEIALGIALQMFGGLRRGEVVNLTRNNIPTNFLDGDNSLIVEDNQTILFSHLQSISKEQVKNPRPQSVLYNDYLKNIYNKHITGLSSLKNVKNMYAVFTNRDGNPISGDSYEKKFNLVKKKYIEILSKTSGRYGDYKMLTDSIWGTHVCRGTFTNYLFDSQVDARQMAIARGDLSTETAALYVDQRKALANYQDAMSKISKVDYLYKKMDFKVE